MVINMMENMELKQTIWDQEKMIHSDAEDVDFEIWFWVINAVESDVNMNNCGKEDQ